MAGGESIVAGHTRIDAAGARGRRPIGAVVLAVVFIFLGAWLAGGGIVRLFQDALVDGAGVQLLDLLKKLQLVSLGLLAIAAGIELLRGSKTGWWLAIVLAYVVFATFVVLASFHRGIAGQVSWYAFKAAVCGALLIYLCRPKVREYFQAGTPTWKTHTAICAVSVAAVLALCVW